MKLEKIAKRFSNYLPLSSIINRSLAASWTRNSVVYQIYPRSFKDSNGDGIGDLQGIIDSLDYLNDGTANSLGIGAIWLSPIFPSPMKDFGYDITDYNSIDPLFGDMRTFNNLVAECHWRGINVIIDFVFNHTSDLHPWFLESKTAKNNPKSDWYIWKDPAPDGSAPNNWLSVFGGPAWEYVPERNQYYLHSFTKEQPDLDRRNPDVEKEAQRILHFWLDHGVDGFRVDAANHLLKDLLFRDEPLNPDYIEGTTKPWYKYLHPYMRNRPDNPELLGSMAQFVGTYGDTAMITEANIPYIDMRKYYRSSLNHRLIPFNFNLFKLPWDAKAYEKSIEEYESILDPLDLPTIVLGNHDRARLVTRIGKENARIAAMLSLTLHGMPFIYNGDEIGMSNTPIPKDAIQDPFGKITEREGRDPQRTPFQWNTKKYAGFSTHKPWLPVNENYQHCNVEKETADHTSLLSLYKALIHIRNASPALKHGTYQTIKTKNPSLFVYIRKEKKETVLVVLNFSDKQTHLKLRNKKDQGICVITTYMDQKDPSPVSLSTLPIRPQEGLLITL